MKKKKEKILIIIAIIALIAIIGITYAFYSLSLFGDKVHTFTSGAITFKYSESSQGISLNNALPMTDEEGMSQNNYFEFEIDAKTTEVFDIPYYITARKSGTGTNMDDIIKLYLTTVDDNGTETPVKLGSTSNIIKASQLGTYTNFSINIPINEGLLYQGRVVAGSENFNQKFRFRMWIDYDCEWLVQENGEDIYPYQNKTYDIKINVYGNGEA